MHFGSHFGAFLTGGILLLVGVFLVLRYRRNKTWWWAAAGVLALVGAVILAANGWFLWPKATAERFIGLVSNSQYDEANAFLPASSKWQIADDGSLTIRAEDGTSATLSKDSLPLLAAGGGASSRSIGDILAGRDNFQVGTIRNRPCFVDCTAERGAVRCRHIEVFGK